MRSPWLLVGFALVAAACGDNAECDLDPFPAGDLDGHAEPLKSGNTQARAGRVTASDLPPVRVATIYRVLASTAQWRRIAPALEPELADLARRTADAHLAASLPHVAGDYMGEHWLATFALLALEA